MLTQADNLLITQTGPGTPVGNAMRRYWMPAFLSEEIPEPDSPPVRVGLLGERLVAFRDSAGVVGLVAESCPHRGASLFFGRNEESGLRCVYHGWKFDTTGACVDMPNEPADSNFKHKIRLQSYSCVEAGGVVWAYLGPDEKQPPLPGFEWMRLAEGHYSMSKTFEDCNYLQGIEGGIDSSHSSFLHRRLDQHATSLGTQGFRARATNPRLEVVSTDYGYMYASLRHLKDEERNYVRVYQFVMPFHQMRAYEGYDGRPVIQGHMWVPIDDESHWVYNWIYATDGSRLTQRELALEASETGRAPEHLIAGTYRPIRGRHNDYLIDRQAQKTKSFTGIEGVNTQDIAVQESMGQVYDRTKEHLGTSDAAVIATRRLLLQAAREVMNGRDPVGAMSSASGVRAAEMVLPDQVTWHEAMREAVLARW